MFTLRRQGRGKSARSRISRIVLNLETLESRNLMDAGLPGLVTNYANYASDHVLVRFADSVAPTLSLPAGATAEALPLVDGLYSVQLPAGWSVDQALASFKALPGALYVQPDYQVSADFVPNDDQFASQWDMLNTGQSGGTVGADMHSTAAWDFTTGTRHTIVAVIDTGVDYNHPDLAANMWTNPGEVPGNGIDDDHNGYIDDIHGFNFVNNTGDPMDDNSHGTHVAGTIGAIGNNGIGVAGVDWNVQIMALKFLDSTGSGSTSAAVSALNYAVQMGANISNNSWGGGGFSQALSDAISNARSHGHIFVAAAGNSSANNDISPFYPASYNFDNVVSVAGTDNYDQLASWSNYGATTVDIAAPGTNILSTLPGGGYGYKSGTSMATPHVTGALALVWDAHPTWSYSQVVQAVLSTADPLPSLSGKVITGGRLDVAAAINASPPAPQPAPNAPSSLSAAGVTINGGTLSWLDNSTNETGIAIERQTNGTWSQIATVGAGGTTYQDSGLASSTSYSYRVRAFNSSGYSAYSNTASITTAVDPNAVPAMPTGLSASIKTKPRLKVTLSWKDNANNETGYRVFRSVDGGVTWTQVAQLGANATSYADSAVTAGKAYVYRVAAYNGNGQSAYSSILNVTTPGGLSVRSLTATIVEGLNGVNSHLKGRLWRWW